MGVVCLIYIYFAGCVFCVSKLYMTRHLYAWMAFVVVNDSLNKIHYKYKFVSYGPIYCLCIVIYYIFLVKDFLYYIQKYRNF